MQGDFEGSDGLEGKNLDRAFARKTSPPPVVFDDVWPSETRGDGNIVKNNRRDGSAQGKGSLLKKAHCRLCGFPNDLIAIDHSGGSLDGNGACYLVSSGTTTYQLLNGGYASETWGNPGIRRGSGCANCGTKNSTKQRTLWTMGNPWDRVQPLGF